MAEDLGSGTEDSHLVLMTQAVQLVTLPQPTPFIHLPGAWLVVR